MHPVAAIGDSVRRPAAGGPALMREGFLAPDPFGDVQTLGTQMDQDRPQLVVGFAAETDDVIANATAKRTRKGCDWIVANDVSPGTGIMGGSENAVTLIDEDGAESWPRQSKSDVARRLAGRIADALAQ